MGIFGRDDKGQPAPTPAPQRPAPPPRQQTPEKTTAGDRSVLARSCNFDGVLRTSGDLTVEGRLTGEIHSSGIITIAETGRVEADVHGRAVSIAGSLKGDVQADERIELEPSANVHGNIVSPRILIKDGATFEGQVFMKNPPKSVQVSAKPEPEVGNGGGNGNKHDKKKG